MPLEEYHSGSEDDTSEEDEEAYLPTARGRHERSVGIYQLYCSLYPGSYWVQRSLLRTRRGETGYKADCIVPQHKRGFEVDLTATYISCHRDKLL